MEGPSQRATAPAAADQDGVYVVIAAYNESEVIGDVVRMVREFYTHVIVVDDGSDDDTSGLARKAGATVLRHIVNRGQGAALQTAITFALRNGATCIVSFDGDGQHSRDDIASLTQPILEGRCDVALGTRFIGHAGNIPFARRSLLRLAVLFTRIVCGLPVTDTHNGLRAFSSHAAAKLDITLDRMAHASQILDQIKQHDLRMMEVPVQVKYTAYSLGKGQSSRGALRILIHYLMGRLLR